MTKIINFQTDPSQYKHWKVEYDGAVANLFMDVDEDGGLFDGYQLKLNSYDLGVDIELADVVQRMRFEHPESQSGGDAISQGQGVLRWREYSDAGRRGTQPQSEFL